MDAHDNSPLSQATPLGLLQQVRQLSIPAWVRYGALALALATFAVGLWLLGAGIIACHTAECDERLLETGSRIVAVAFLPVLVLIYLAFAQTGVAALARKSRALLAETIPTVLAARGGDAAAIGSRHDILRSTVQTFHNDGVPSARYRLELARADSAAELWFQVDLNVSKVNVTVFIPWEAPRPAQEAREWLERFFPVSFEGARHEGYTVDSSIGLIDDAERRFVTVCARRRLAADFLWDPAAKLYFAQDLRYFLFSLAGEGWELLRPPPAPPQAQP
ncbi:hypothetical protein [Pseudothauera rhizosphaerae]|uniref:hypothetical protein n=1 Tax=Pseudothauera rhizosphaerae TaxID=2565932 RepID=UPI001454D974|nr:hypothetical protein [Pseudothauera rhizosphaerae]